MVAPMRIALLQAAGTPGDVAANLRRVGQAAQAAARAGARLLITPEAFVTGYNIGAGRVAELAEPPEGPSARAIAAHAAAHDVAILAGLPERDGSAVYATGLLVDAGGTTLAGYRKTHLFGDIDRSAYTAGGHLVTAWIEDVRLGLLVSVDVEFPEPARQLALAGVHLLAVPTALMAGGEHVAEAIVPARASENCVYVAYVNRVGRERDVRYVGRSCLASPDGTRVAAGPGAEVLLLADVDPAVVARARKERSLVEEPRPALYAAPAR
jgi:predicted amidohydrolase